MSAGARTGWYWSDWLGDQAVRNLTPAERGVWIDLLALMAAAAPTGYLCDCKGRPLTLEEIARVTNAGSPDEVAKLIRGITEKGAASRDRTGRLYNRRMVREAEVAAKKSRNGKAGGAATRLKWQAFSAAPQQNAWQNAWHQERSPYLKERDITSSFFVPRAKEEQKTDFQGSEDLASIVKRKGWTTEEES